MNRKAWCGVLTAVLFVLAAGVVFAQAEGEVEVHKKSWFDLFKATGIVGILLLILSLVGTALSLQHIVGMNEQKIGNPALMREVEDMLTEGNLDEAFSVVQADQSYAGKVLAGALARSFGGPEEMRKGMEESAAVEAFRLNSKISYVSLVGNIGPLLGLLGTVTGMISSFQVIETKKSPTPADLAVGVYESLVNTTMGLFISIVFLTVFFYLKNKVSDITLRLNNQINEMLARAGSEGGGEQAAK